MKPTFARNWRDSASLILLAKRQIDIASRITENSNYEILLQTRTKSASFANSVVFPGGVYEEADSSENWLQHLKSFGYNQNDFEKLYKSNTSVSPIFAHDPVRRFLSIPCLHPSICPSWALSSTTHWYCEDYDVIILCIGLMIAFIIYYRHISLRITAIRETFEELGILIGSTNHKKNKSETDVSIISDVNVEYWQQQVSNDPSQLLNLCKEYNCYPDIWNLYYWSNWLSPTHLPKRFDTAFFIAKLDSKPEHIRCNSEVVKSEWAIPRDILDRQKKSLILQPPQIYEFHRLSQISDVDKLINLAEERSCYSDEHLYPVIIRVKDGTIFLLPGDYQYPSNVSYDHKDTIVIDKTAEELRDLTKPVHRFEVLDTQAQLVVQNCVPAHHINMGNQIFPYRLNRN